VANLVKTDYGRVRQDFERLKQRCGEAGVPVVERVVSATEALLVAARPRSAEAEREMIEMVARSLDLMALLVTDANRRQQGYPPAALQEAVVVLLEQMERLKSEIAA
jgi:chemotaxis protein histidine kinase CheA